MAGLLRGREFSRAMQLPRPLKPNRRMKTMVLAAAVLAFVFGIVYAVIISTRPSYRHVFDQQRNQNYPFEKRSVSVLQPFLKSRESWGSADWNSEVLRVIHLNTVSEDKMVMVVLVNYGAKEMLMNWIASLEMNGYHKWVAFCVDFQIYTFLVEYGYADNAVVVPRQWLHKDLTAQEAQYRQPGFVDLMQAKVLIIIELLKLNVHLFYLDVDIVFCSPHVVDHILFDDSFTNTDFLYMVDSHDAVNPNYINGGFWLARPTQAMIQFFMEVFSMVTERGVLLEQDAMYLTYRKMSRDRQKFTGRPLDKLLYPSGWVFWQENLNAKFGIKPLVVHMNWILGNKAKKAKLRQSGLWFVDEQFAD